MMLSARRFRSLRIGIFTDTYAPQINGVVTSIQLMDKVLRDHGHQTFIFTLKHPRAEPTSDPDHVFRVPSVRFYGNSDHRVGLIYSRSAMEQARSLELDVIHSHAPFSLGVFGHISARRLCLPEVHTYHTMLEDYTHYVSRQKITNEAARRVARRYSRIFCNWSTTIIVPTTKVKQALLDYGVTRPIFVLPTGVDLERFRPLASEHERNQQRRRLGLGFDGPLLVFVGRLAKEKSIDTLIKYHTQVIEAYPNCHLVIVGDGDERQHLQSYAQRLGLARSVHFVGAKSGNELPLYYQIADVFVIASRSETQGLVVPEALACGVPVLAANDPAFHNLVVPGRTGYLFADSRQYVDHLQQLLEAGGAANFGSAARMSVETLSTGEFYRQLVHVYEEAIRIGPRKPNRYRSSVLEVLRRRRRSDPDSRICNPGWGLIFVGLVCWLLKIRSATQSGPLLKVARRLKITQGLVNL